MNEASLALARFATKRLNGTEYDTAARGTAALDPIALALLRPRGTSSVELSGGGNVKPEDELLFKRSLEILQERGVHKIGTEELVRALVERGDPWVGRWGTAVASGNIAGPARQLAARLRLYGTNPRTIRIGSTVRKGYRIEDLASGLSRYQRSQDDPEARTPTGLRGHVKRSNPAMVNRVLRRVGVLGSFVERLNNDREFLKCMLQQLDPHFRTLQESLRRLRNGGSFSIRFNALPQDLLTDASRGAMGIRNEVGLFERAGWRLRWCSHKGHFYVGTVRGRVPIDCPAHRYGGRKARAKRDSVKASASQQTHTDVI